MLNAKKEMKQYHSIIHEKVETRSWSERNNNIRSKTKHQKNRKVMPF